MQIVSINFTHDYTLVLYKQLMQTGSVLLLLPLSSVLGFPLYEDTANGRAATHQLYSFAIEVWFGANIFNSWQRPILVHKTIKKNPDSTGLKQ